MAERLRNYLEYCERMKNSELSPEKLAAYEKDLLTQIAFFAHERLIHLIVTVLFAVVTFMTLGLVLITNKMSCLVLMCALLVLLIPYIFHYYKLENGVQKLYTYYDDIQLKK